MLETIKDINHYKRSFFLKLNRTLDEHHEFKKFMHEILVYGTAYVVGGFLRDIANGKQSRDLDMIIDLPHHKIEQFLRASKLNFRINRMNGVKIILQNFEVDLWSIDDNWAFKNVVVKRSNSNILDSIANGCFYNFDSLVININTQNFVAKNYNSCIRNNELDIIQKREKYHKKNPTIEANILKAFYLQKEFGLNFSENCLSYIVKRINFLENQYINPIDRLMSFIPKYIKYQPHLDRETLTHLILKAKKDIKSMKTPTSDNKTQYKLFKA